MTGLAPATQASEGEDFATARLVPTVARTGSLSIE